MRTVGSDELGQAEVTAIRDVLNAAFGDEPDEAFTEEDWDHAVGGLHFILEENGTVAAHASVVERELHTSGHRLATGYVEAVATRPYLQGRVIPTPEEDGLVLVRLTPSSPELDLSAPISCDWRLGDVW